ncbi:MAG: 50S ribosomal protein L25/general stress protein Ctc [Rickettsiaceae bacterium]|nr:50S ribosomal protein L25/general stress protein Ctc [Rickettsiaceae bacterium]
MSTNTVLKCEIRENSGTGGARELRKRGRVPAIVYGKGQTNISISLEEKEITKLYRKQGFKSTVLELDLDGKSYKVLPKAVELHPITELVRHADFVFLPEKGYQKVSVPILYEGKDRCIGLKRGGFFNIIHRKLELNCPVDQIPTFVEIPVAHLYIGSSIRSDSISLPEGCTLIENKSMILASITGRGGKSADAGAEGAAAAAPAKK